MALIQCKHFDRPLSIHLFVIRNQIFRWIIFPFSSFRSYRAVRNSLPIHYYYYGSENQFEIGRPLSSSAKDGGVIDWCSFAVLPLNVMQQRSASCSRDISTFDNKIEFQKNKYIVIHWYHSDTYPKSENTDLNWIFPSCDTKRVRNINKININERWNPINEEKGNNNHFEILIKKKQQQQQANEKDI